MISRSPKRRRHGVVRTKGPIVRVSNSTSLRVMFMAAPHRADWCQNSLTRHPCGKVRNTSLKQSKEARVFRRAQAVREVVKGQRLQTVSDTLHFTYSALRKWV